MMKYRDAFNCPAGECVGGPTLVDIVRGNQPVSPLGINADRHQSDIRRMAYTVIFEDETVWIPLPRPDHCIVERAADKP